MKRNTAVLLSVVIIAAAGEILSAQNPTVSTGGDFKPWDVAVPSRTEARTETAARPRSDRHRRRRSAGKNTDRKLICVICG